MSQIRIWGRVNSSNVQKVLMLCEEIGLPFERIDAGGAFGRTRDADYAAMNPNATVPTLQDGDFSLWESHAILRYLAAREKADSFYPVDLKARADVDRWLDWSSLTFAPAITPAFWGLIRQSAAERSTQAVINASTATANAVAILERQVTGKKFLCGDNLTLADLSIGPNLHRWFALPFEQVGFQRPATPAVSAWYQRLCDRPAYRKFAMPALT